MVSQKYFVKGNKIYLWQKLCQQTIRLNKMKFQKSERNVHLPEASHNMEFNGCKSDSMAKNHWSFLYNFTMYICIFSTFFFSTNSIYSMLLLHCFNNNLSFYINQRMTQIETLWFLCHIKKIQFVRYTSNNLWLNTQTFHRI